VALTAKQKKQIVADLEFGRRIPDVIRFRGFKPEDVVKWRRDNAQEAQKAFFRSREGEGNKADRLERLQSFRAQIVTNLAAVDERIAEVESEGE